MLVALGGLMKRKVEDRDELVRLIKLVVAGYLPVLLQAFKGWHDKWLPKMLSFEFFTGRAKLELLSLKKLGSLSLFLLLLQHCCKLLECLLIPLSRVGPVISLRQAGMPQSHTSLALPFLF